MNEVSIEEKVKAVFEWAGLTVKSEYIDAVFSCFSSIERWICRKDKEVFFLPMPDDIEFLGYMDKYPLSKLQKDYELIAINYSIPEFELDLWDCMLEFLNESPTKRKGETRPIALLNAIYELIIREV